jgi:hypothetical protein
LVVLHQKQSELLVALSRRLHMSPDFKTSDHHAAEETRLAATKQTAFPENNACASSRAAALPGSSTSSEDVTASLVVLQKGFKGMLAFPDASCYDASSGGKVALGALSSESKLSGPVLREPHSDNENEASTWAAALGTPPSIEKSFRYAPCEPFTE